MRKLGTVLASFGLLLACNAILGNEDHYTLGDGGGATAGADGETGGSSTTGGSKTSGGTKASGGTKPGGGGAQTSGGAGTGAVTAAGASGEGGERGCVTSTPEDCFNGVDDDCNGDVDCADDACNGPAKCQPDSEDGDLGTFLPAGGACPAGTTAVTLHRQLSAKPECEGCTCVAQTSGCDTSFGNHGAFACPGFQVSGNTFDVDTNHCEKIPGGTTSIHYYDVRGTTECAPQGTSKVSQAMWGETATFCRADHVGAGCAAGFSCLPAFTTTACNLTTGASDCAGNYPAASGEPWATAFTDTRKCSACQCALGISACTGTKIQLYSTPNCTGNPYSVGTGEQGDDCSLPFVPQSGRVAGTPAGNSCEQNTYPNGELAVKDPHSVCCR